MSIVAKLDKQRNRVDIVYFDGASNVQKAGEVLEVTFPGTVAYHGGEHVIALWFTLLAQIPEIKVCIFVILSVLFYGFV